MSFSWLFMCDSKIKKKVTKEEKKKYFLVWTIIIDNDACYKSDEEKVMWIKWWKGLTR